MKLLPHLFQNNRQWAARQTSGDPQYFERLREIQRPEYLWIGCSDSRVPANTIIGLEPGEVFVHRNVANIVQADDRNCLTVLQYAVDVLKVAHVIVCGHYRCGGVQAALGPPTPEPLETWLKPLRALCGSHRHELEAAADEEARWRLLCEISVRSQVQALSGLQTVRHAWERSQRLAIHGWIYGLDDGLLHDLDVTVDGPAL